MTKLNLGVSSCLLGNKVRYDGNHKLNHYIAETLSNFFKLVPVCPETECGLGIPRESMHLVRQDNSIHLVTTKSGKDLTSLFDNWLINKLSDLPNDNLCGFIFKTKSPSCGLIDTKILDSDSTSVNKGSGLFAKAFTLKFPLIPVIDDGRLHDPVRRENFLERVFIYSRWKECINQNSTGYDLIRFHEKHKLLIMSHSQQKLKNLGKIVSSCGKELSSDLKNEYINLLMDCMALIATVKKQTNVLQHIEGHLKGILSLEQKKELQEIIDSYHNGVVPLIAPITLIRHYIRILNVPYLKEQVYFDPYPAELKPGIHL